MIRENGVWAPPGATTFSCLCEACLEVARDDGRCAAGHEVVVRRVSTPSPLRRGDTHQLQIV